MTTAYVLPSVVRELRFILSTDTSSAGLRSFINKTYPTLKRHNPNTPLLIRESTVGTVPSVYARFPFGLEKRIRVPDLSESDVEKAIQNLIVQ